MTIDIKPIMVWGGLLGPNPSKVCLILEKLSLPWTAVDVPFSEVKSPEYTKINPNGRLPTIEDPNTGLRLWETGAIIEYLIEKYDTDFGISYEPGTEEYYLSKQWLYLQTTGQGPYYGQATYFMFLNPEKIQACIDRYVNEIKRISAVLDKHLSTNQWLVGDKCTYADISFIPWQQLAFGPMTAAYFDSKKDFPNVQRWLDEMLAMKPIARVMAEKEEKTKAQNAEPAKLAEAAKEGK